MSEALELCKKIITDLVNGDSEEAVISRLAAQYNQTPEQAQVLVDQAKNLMSASGITPKIEPKKWWEFWK